MAKLIVNSESLVSVADAIREKGGTSDSLEFPQGFVDGINAIESGGGDGFSPIVDITEITGGHRITITDANGTESFDVLDGKDGYTPIKGVDYFDGKDGEPYTLTEVDKTEITNAVIEALPKYEGEVSEV